MPGLSPFARWVLVGPPWGAIGVIIGVFLHEPSQGELPKALWPESLHPTMSRSTNGASQGSIGRPQGTGTFHEAAPKKARCGPFGSGRTSRRI